MAAQHVGGVRVPDRAHHLPYIAALVFRGLVVVAGELLLHEYSHHSIQWNEGTPVRSFPVCTLICIHCLSLWQVIIIAYDCCNDQQILQTHGYKAKPEVTLQSVLHRGELRMCDVNLEHRTVQHQSHFVVPLAFGFCCTGLPLPVASLLLLLR